MDMLMWVVWVEYVVLFVLVGLFLVGVLMLGATGGLCGVGRGLCCRLLFL